jgi:serine/threonine protein kinase
VKASILIKLGLLKKDSDEAKGS